MVQVCRTRHRIWGEGAAAVIKTANTIKTRSNSFHSYAVYRYRGVHDVFRARARRIRTYFFLLRWYQYVEHVYVS